MGFAISDRRITETAAIVSWWLEIIESLGTAAAVGAAKIFSHRQQEGSRRIPKTVAVSRWLEIIESLGTAATVGAAAPLVALIFSYRQQEVQPRNCISSSIGCAKRGNPETILGGHSVYAKQKSKS